MRIVRAGLRPALGLLVIAHGLAHAVMPMRGWMDPATLALDFTPFLLYVVAVAGFTLAGLGLLGVRRLDPVVRPALVLASAYSLISLFVMGDGGLWWGRALDVILLLTGLSGAYRYLPHPETRAGAVRVALESFAAGAAVYGAIAVAAWPLHRAWGSDPADHALPLPGDRAARNPALELQHVVTIDAPPQEVWRWLVQIGQDRAGFYSYDWLERAFGVDIHNANEIRPEWQSRQAGDRVHATQANYLRGLFGAEPGWTVTAVEPNRAMVLQYLGRIRAPADGGWTHAIHHPHESRRRTDAAVDRRARHDGVRDTALHHAAANDVADQGARGSERQCERVIRPVAGRGRYDDRAGGNASVNTPPRQIARYVTDPMRGPASGASCRAITSKPT